MPTFDDFEVWIEVDGKKLDEFGPKQGTYSDGSALRTCYVPSKAGKQFRIGFSLPKSKAKRTNYGLAVFIDGYEPRLVFNMVEKNRSLKEDVVDYIEAEVTGNRTTRCFQFGGLRLTDDDAYVGMEDEDLGTIEFQLRSYTRARVDKKGGRKYNAADAKSDYLHERSKKCLTHCVTLGEEVAHDESEGEGFDTYGDKDICTFQFFYRSIDTLIANGIAPRRASPSCVASSSTTPNSSSNKSSQTIALDAPSSNAAGTPENPAQPFPPPSSPPSPLQNQGRDASTASVDPGTTSARDSSLASSVSVPPSTIPQGHPPNSTAGKRKQGPMRGEEKGETGPESLDTALEIQRQGARLSTPNRVEEGGSLSMREVKPELKAEPSIVDLTAVKEADVSSQSTVEEIRGLRERLAQLERRLIKEEEVEEGNGEPGSKRVKREHRSTTPRGEVIDLTL